MVQAGGLLEAKARLADLAYVINKARALIEHAERIRAQGTGKIGNMIAPIDGKSEAMIGQLQEFLAVHCPGLRISVEAHGSSHTLRTVTCAWLEGSGP